MTNTKNFKEVEVKFKASASTLKKIWIWLYNNQEGYFTKYIPDSTDYYFTVKKNRILRARINDDQGIELTYKDQRDSVIERKEINLNVTNNDLGAVLELLGELGKYEFKITKEVFIWELEKVILALYRIGRDWYFEIESLHESLDDVVEVWDSLVEAKAIPKYAINRSLYDIYTGGNNG